MVGHWEAGRPSAGCFGPGRRCADHSRRRASLTCFIFSEQTLHLLRQDPRRGKEEGGNWRQRTRNPSVPVSLFVEYEINNISRTERSEARRVATLHTDVSRVRVSETWRVACSHALSASSTSQTRPGARAHGNTASFPQEPCSFPLVMHSLLLLGRSLLKVPCSEWMSHVASTASKNCSMRK